jgi:transposase
VSFSTVRGILEGHVPIGGPVPWGRICAGGPVRLGIDGHSFRGHSFVLTVQDLTHGRPVAMLRGESRETLGSFLASIPSDVRRNLVSEVCTDLTNRLRAPIAEWLPNARHVADKFHVIALLNRAIDEERKGVASRWKGLCRNQKEVSRLRYVLLKRPDGLNAEKGEPELRDGLLSRCPTLMRLYDLKKELYRFYAEKDPNVLERLCRLDVWDRPSRRTLSRDDLLTYSPRFRTFVKTLQSWKKEIANTLASGTTNAYVEGKHTKYQLIKRMSYGFRNITLYRQKLLLSSGLATNPLSLHFGTHTI